MSTRSKSAKDNKMVKKTSNRIICDRKVFFIKDELLKETDEKYSLDIVPLRNPRTNQKSLYLFSDEDKKLFEILYFDESHRSWFINKTVCSNGRIYLTTPIDPIFLLLQYVFKECQIKAIPLQQLLKDEEFVYTGRLLSTLHEDQIDMIGDCKRFGDITAIKFNEEKTMDWLKLKCELLVEALKKHRIHVGLGAISATYIKSEKITDNIIDTGEYIRYAYGLVSEYLSEDVSMLLMKHLNIQPISGLLSNKRKSQSQSDVIDDDDSAEDTKEKKPKKTKKEIVSSLKQESEIEFKPVSPMVDANGEKKQSAKTKALAKAASGTKSISSFFKKA